MTTDFVLWAVTLLTFFNDLAHITRINPDIWETKAIFIFFHILALICIITLYLSFIIKLRNKK